MCRRVETATSPAVCPVQMLGCFALRFFVPIYRPAFASLGRVFWEGQVVKYGVGIGEWQDSPIPRREADASNRDCWKDLFGDNYFPGNC